MANEELRSIVNRIVSRTAPLHVILFGSFARNEETKDSDYDICLIVSDETDRFETTGNAYDALWGMKRRAVDIIVDSESDFNYRKELPSIERTIAREGLVLYRKNQ